MRYELLSVSFDSRELESWLAFAGFKARDLRDPLRKSLNEVVVPAIREQILSQGARSGDPYEGLNDDYEEEKMDAVGFTIPILVRSGQMLQDLTADTATRVFMDHAWYRPDNDYAHWHQTGGYVEGRPPQRVILDLIPEDYEEIQSIFNAWLAELRDANRTRRGPGTLPDFNIADSFNIL